MQEEMKCPVTGITRKSIAGRRHFKPGLVAEPGELQYSSSELKLEQSDG